MLFFFNDTATTEIYTLSLHDALPISLGLERFSSPAQTPVQIGYRLGVKVLTVSVVAVWFLHHDLSPYFWLAALDRKSTRLNSSHANISYAVFCLQNKDRGPCAPA